MTNQSTGQLKGWRYDAVHKVFWGHLFDDIRGRWPDGTYIHTSHCPFPDAKKGDIVKTLNSTYLLGEPL